MPAGRPLKLTKELTAKIVALLHVGNYVETAAGACGLSKDTLYRWLKEGARNPASPYAEFSDAVVKAMLAGEVSLVGIIERAARGDKDKPGAWQAAAWMLERTRSTRFGYKQSAEVKAEVTGKDGGPVQVATGEVLTKIIDAAAAEELAAGDDDADPADDD